MDGRRRRGGEEEGVDKERVRSELNMVNSFILFFLSSSFSRESSLAESLSFLCRLFFQSFSASSFLSTSAKRNLAGLMGVSKGSGMYFSSTSGGDEDKDQDGDGDEDKGSGWGWGWG